MNILKKVILYLWQLPQNLIGLVVLFVNRRNYKKKIIYVDPKSKKVTYYIVKHLMDCGISLGNYIFFDSDRFFYYQNIRHEYGHQIQSRYFGWFYLIVIGIPSAIGNLIDRIKPIDYYNQPCEKWADKLGGVER